MRHLDRLADEGHRSERVACWWHLSVGTLALVTGATSFCWHLFCAHRHARAARTKEW